MKKIGELATEGGSGTIYQDGSEFVFRYKTRGPKGEDGNHSIEEVNERHATLESLREKYKNFHFRPEGSDSFVVNIDPERSRKMAEMARELEALYDERDKSNVEQ